MQKQTHKHHHSSGHKHHHSSGHKHHHSSGHDTRHVDEFITETLSGDNLDLSKYGDDKFRAEMRLVTINTIASMFSNASKTHLKHKPKKTMADLMKVINTISTKHGEKGLSMLDYSLMGGFQELATKFAQYGANSSQVNHFAKKLTRYFSDSKAKNIIENVNEEIRRVARSSSLSAATRQSTLSASSAASMQQRAENILYDNRYSILFLTIGISCMIAGPLVHGIASPILLSIGGPSFGYGLKTLPLCNERPRSRASSSQESPNELEDKIKELIATIARHKHNSELKLELLRIPELLESPVHSRQLTIPAKRAHKAVTAPPKKPMLFRFGSDSSGGSTMSNEEFATATKRRAMSLG